MFRSSWGEEGKDFNPLMVSVVRGPKLSKLDEFLNKIRDYT